MVRNPDCHLAAPAQKRNRTAEADPEKEKKGKLASYLGPAMAMFVDMTPEQWRTKGQEKKSTTRFASKDDVELSARRAVGRRGFFEVNSKFTSCVELRNNKVR